MMNKKPTIFCWISSILVIIGAINWGLIGVFHFNVVSTLFGSMSTVSRIIYTLVGVAGVYAIFALCKCCKSCGSNNSCS